MVFRSRDVGKRTLTPSGNGRGGKGGKNLGFLNNLLGNRGWVKREIQRMRTGEGRRTTCL